METPASNAVSIRGATPDDAQGVLDIYGPAVEQSSATFETTVPEIDDIRNRITAVTMTHAWLVVPNKASEDLHQKLGFEAIGVFKKVGLKFGRWHDVSWWQRKLQDGLPDL